MAKTAANPVYRVTTDDNANSNVIVQRTNHVTGNMVVFVDLVLQGQTVMQFVLKANLEPTVRKIVYVL